jgi:hypothetical protein
MGEFGGRNLYGFDRNGPSNRIDPLGLGDLQWVVRPDGSLILQYRDGPKDAWITIGTLSTAWQGYAQMDSCGRKRLVSLDLVAQAAHDIGNWYLFYLNDGPDTEEEWRAWAAKNGLSPEATAEKIFGLKAALVLRHRLLAEVGEEAPSAEEEAEIVRAIDAAADLLQDLLTFYATAPLDLQAAVRSMADAAFIGGLARRGIGPGANVCGRSRIVYVAAKLSETEADNLRRAAQRVWETRAGWRASARDLRIHHRIPLEWAHLWPYADPNRVANLVGVSTN